MTHHETLAALKGFQDSIQELSRQYPEDCDFWPAYAEQANDLESAAPIEFRDYVRASILRTMQTLARTRD